jgi:hypothetical protein
MSENAIEIRSKPHQHMMDSTVEVTRAKEDKTSFFLLCHCWNT